MTRRKQIPRIPLTPTERRQRSREVLVEEVMELVIEGKTLASISQREHMPSYDTLQRWHATDSAFRRRYDGALMFQQHVMADDVLRIADDYAAAQHGRARIKAARFQIAARNWWIEFHRKDALNNETKTDNSPSAMTARFAGALERARKYDEEERNRRGIILDDGKDNDE